VQGIRATVVGNLTADPVVKPVGATTVANFDVAVNDGYRDKNTGAWVDKETTYVRAAAWAQLAENVGDTLSKGDEVVLTGTLSLEQYETKEGDKRSALVLTVTEVGVSLRWSVAEVKKVKKGTRSPFVTPGPASAAVTPAPASSDAPPF